MPSPSRSRSRSANAPTRKSGSKTASAADENVQQPQPASPAKGRATAASPRPTGPAGGHNPLDGQLRCDSEIPLVVQFTTYLGYALLMLFGYIRETFRYFFPAVGRKCAAGYAPIVRDFDDFYQRRLYYRIRDCWNRPIDSRPSRIIGVMERVSKDYNITFNYTGRIIPCINFASYNYLGFAEELPAVTEQVLDCLDQYGVASCSAPMELGQTHVVSELEAAIAKFVGKDDAIVCGMGFATNFAGLPALFDKDTLVISDSLNHASLVGGVRMSECKVKVFPHNNYHALEKLIEGALVEGQPRTHRKWRRIVVVVEGIYSMEGEITDLQKLIEVKKKYKVLLYVDEAHSIGALGVSGRGICEHCGVDPRDVDILMGTFTKSFGSIGGYIAADKAVIDYLRHCSSSSLSADSISPGAAMQALGALRVILGEDGTDVGRRKIQQLAANSRYFRRRLIELGLTVFGDDASPVVPAMLYNPAKMPAFSRECLKRNLAVVVVGYPATSLIESRVRFCVSACHTKEDLDRALAAIDEVASDVMIRYERLKKKKG